MTINGEEWEWGTIEKEMEMNVRDSWRLMAFRHHESIVDVVAGFQDFGWVLVR